MNEGNEGEQESTAEQASAESSSDSSTEHESTATSDSPEPDASEGSGSDGDDVEGGSRRLECDGCGEPVSLDDRRCQECGAVQFTSIANIRKYGALGAVGLVLTFLFGRATVLALPPTDILSFFILLVMVAIALIGPILLAVAGLGYRRRKEVQSS